MHAYHACLWETICQNSLNIEAYPVAAHLGVPLEGVLNPASLSKGRKDNEKVRLRVS